MENGGTAVARDECLWRRIHRDHFVKGRVTTAAFKDPSMSVDIARLQGDKRITLQDGVGIAAFKAADAYDEGQTVVADPEEGNKAHALVIGHKPGSVAKAFRRFSEFISRESIETPPV